MALEYKLEFLYDDSDPADAGVYIHLRRNPPIYQERITKEDYDVLGSGDKNDFLTGILNISGVVELATQAYRVWLMKAPVYYWEEVLEPVLYFIAFFYDEETIEALPGSANIDGTGFTLNTVKNRRRN